MNPARVSNSGRVLNYLYVFIIVNGFTSPLSTSKNHPACEHPLQTVYQIP